ncbi:MAG: hypothetical protein KJO36_13285 [Acidimicrobiia bacterium]|nr:hypothetical protein [Acidimicrobiia bacterium]MBT8249541.1 hypothetical protein [Acidimicrobiia bacterium]NNC42998.1 hypothetical protein [Acidimicrobiia bacterium]NND13149.1 hypothetical protein [Acidimicrobiia bacterium]NNL27714.1 hypothetical protein [Acidimicrobiia bacterium]
MGTGGDVSRSIRWVVDASVMESCTDCKLMAPTIPCQFHELAMRGDWFGELEARLEAVLGPDMLDDVFDVLAGMQTDPPDTWTLMCCRHDLPIGSCVIPTCADLPSFGETPWKIADRAISLGISLN